MSLPPRTLVHRRVRRRSLAAVAATALTLTALLAAPAVAQDPPPAPFTFVVVPDTQAYVRSAVDTPIMGEQMQWIADNRAQLGTAFAASLGDIVELEDVPLEWQRASQYWGILDAAGVPNSTV